MMECIASTKLEATPKPLNFGSFVLLRSHNCGKFKQLDRNRVCCVPTPEDENMIYSIVCDRIDDPSLPPGYFYAHIPALDLTTHGEGIEGAKAAALDLLKLWIAEKTANGESLPVEHECYFSKLEVADAVHGA